MTARRARCERRDQRDIDDSAEPTDANDPADRIEHAEPTDPIDMNEPTDPIESTEPFDPIERNESTEHSDHREVDVASIISRVSRMATIGTDRPLAPPSLTCCTLRRNLSRSGG
jgi:hypothetical protein